MTVKKMSDKTADVLMGQPTTTNDFDADMYVLAKLADQVIEALDTSSDDPYVRFGTGRAMPAFVAPTAPELEFTLPMPEWPTFDYSVPVEADAK